MPGPGRYRRDLPDGPIRREDRPSPRVIRRSRDARRRACPCCGERASRVRQARRILHDLGDPASGRPSVIHLSYSQHYCPECRRYFNTDMADLAPPGGHYTHRVIDAAVRLVVEDGLPYRTASAHLRREHGVLVPFATIRNWVDAAGKKEAHCPAPDRLERASADTRGSLVDDEPFDGPLSIEPVGSPCRPA